MIKGCYNIKKYTEEFILKVSWWIKLLIAPVVALVIVSNYLEIECSKLATSISTDLLQIKSKIIQFGIYLFALETMKYLTNIFITFFVSSSIKRAYFVFMKEYLSIKYEDFTKLSSGDIQYDIQRRSIAISDFLTVLTISFISNAIFFIVVCQKLIVSLSLEAALKSIILVTIFLIVVVYSQRMKSALRVKVNQGFIRNSRKVCDVLLNYERIVAYDNIDIECKKYEDVSKSQEYHAKLFWSSYEFIFFINRILFALLAAFIIYEFKKMNLTTNDLTIFEIIGIINALDPKINALSYSID
ncbi:hypothetical protein A0H76_141 [Hepatospora eriocheir]|uniref:Uncharacterized protein n=1 Tax=Hepatospora eriocheir TaxID=1081669 RepID=A0A1X0QL82_9MICR|nr:hypothetical protein A0H76_141 [Hepatospora eriocheir]